MFLLDSFSQRWSLPFIMIISLEKGDHNPFAYPFFACFAECNTHITFLRQK